MVPKLGLIARGDRTGLSVLTQDLYKFLKPHRTLVVDLSRHSGRKPELSNFGEVEVWNDNVYPDVSLVEDPVLESFLDDVDVVFTCETPYNYWLFERAREKNVKTILQLMYEFLDYSLYDGLPEPDMFLAPSLWNIEDLEDQLPGRDVRFLPVPVDREAFPFKHRTELNTLLHTAGTVAGDDRNGTLLACEAMNFVDPDVSLNVKSQVPIPKLPKGRNINHFIGSHKSPSALYNDEDVFLMPRRFGGLCLPINEAVSTGMPILVPRCDPQTRWVPEELMYDAIPSSTLQTRNQLTLYRSDPLDIAAKINWLKDSPDKVSEYSNWADDYAESISWDKMLPKYRELVMF